MAVLPPCVSAEPGGSQELGTRTSHTCFPHKAAAQTHITLCKNAYYSNCLVCCFWHWHCRLWIFAVRNCCFQLLQSCEISELLNAIFKANYLPQITFFFLISLCQQPKWLSSWVTKFWKACYAGIFYSSVLWEQKYQIWNTFVPGIYILPPSKIHP